VSLLPCQAEQPPLRLAATVRATGTDAAGHPTAAFDTTPFYPEGGGQPGDRGHFGAVPVLDVQRAADGTVWHRMGGPVAVGDAAEAVVDAARRLDFAQQHTAQHLLSALLADAFGAPTVAVHLGEASCTIDLGTDVLRERDVRAVEETANALIREARAVRVRVVAPEALADVAGLRSRGLPPGHQGPVRLIEIDGVDVNTCGGTHMASLAGLQAVAAPRLERHKGGLRLSFVAGGRVLQGFSEALGRQASLGAALRCAPAELPAAVERLQQGAKALMRERDEARAGLAGALGAGLAAGASPGAGVALLARPEGDVAFLRAIADAAATAAPAGRVLVTGGVDGAAAFVLAGPAAWVAAVGPGLAAALEGRGGGSPGRYQGKAARVSAAAAWVAAAGG